MNVLAIHTALIFHRFKSLSAHLEIAFINNFVGIVVILFFFFYISLLLFFKFSQGVQHSFKFWWLFAMDQQAKNLNGGSTDFATNVISSFLENPVER